MLSDFLCIVSTKPKELGGIYQLQTIRFGTDYAVLNLHRQAQ